MALVGEELDPDDAICGAVVSIKPRMERIQLWIRDRGDGPNVAETVNDIGKRMMKVLELSKQDGITFDFQVRD
jgi:translation initiation factor 4E